MRCCSRPVTTSAERFRAKIRTIVVQGARCTWELGVAFRRSPGLLKRWPEAGFAVRFNSPRVAE